MPITIVKNKTKQNTNSIPERPLKDAKAKRENCQGTINLVFMHNLTDYRLKVPLQWRNLVDTTLSQMIKFNITNNGKN